MQPKIIGQTIAEEYVVESHLGGGGMAQVYLAKSNKNNQQVAIKIMNTELLQKPSAVARFKREARLQCKINHPNLVKGFSFGETDDVPYLIMEYVDGPMLSDLIAKRKHLPLDEGIKILYDVVMGLNYLFREEIIHAHRDIKPQNIMITKGGTAKLTDFGIAKANDEQEELTLTSSFLGSPHYMSPEQIKNPRDIDIRSDIYALGTVFYEMVTGSKAYDGESPAEILSAHFEFDPPQISGEDPLVEACNDIFNNTMAANPSDRYQVPAEFKSALNPHVDGAVVIKDPKFSQSTIRFVAILAGILVVTVALVFALLRFIPAGHLPEIVGGADTSEIVDDGLFDDYLDLPPEVHPEGSIMDALDGIARPAGPEQTGGAVEGGGGAGGADDNRRRGQEVINMNENNNR